MDQKLAMEILQAAKPAYAQLKTIVEEANPKREILQKRARISLKYVLIFFGCLFHVLPGLLFYFYFEIKRNEAKKELLTFDQELQDKCSPLFLRIAACGVFDILPDKVASDISDMEVLYGALNSGKAETLSQALSYVEETRYDRSMKGVSLLPSLIAASAVNGNSGITAFLTGWYTSAEQSARQNASVAKGDSFAEKDIRIGIEALVDFAQSLGKNYFDIARRVAEGDGAAMQELAYIFSQTGNQQTAALWQQQAQLCEASASAAKKMQDLEKEAFFLKMRGETEKAQQLNETLAEEGSGDAMVSLYFTYGDNGDKEKAIQILTKAANLGYAEAQFLLSQDLLHKAQWVYKIPEERKACAQQALELAQKAAEQGYKKAWYQLSDITCSHLLHTGENKVSEDVAETDYKIALGHYLAKAAEFITNWDEWVSFFYAACHVHQQWGKIKVSHLETALFNAYCIHYAQLRDGYNDEMAMVKTILENNTSILTPDVDQRSRLKAQKTITELSAVF